MYTIFCTSNALFEVGTRYLTIDQKEPHINDLELYLHTSELAGRKFADDTANNMWWSYVEEDSDKGNTCDFLSA